MGKGYALIVLGCILSIAIIVVITQLAINFMETGCELSSIEPSISPKTWSKMKMMSSHDGSFAIKIFAYLEYLNETSSSSTLNPTASALIRPATAISPNLDVATIVTTTIAPQPVLGAASLWSNLTSALGLGRLQSQQVVTNVIPTPIPQPAIVDGRSGLININNETSTPTFAPVLPQTEVSSIKNMTDHSVSPTTSTSTTTTTTTTTFTTTIPKGVNQIETQINSSSSTNSSLSTKAISRFLLLDLERIETKKQTEPNVEYTLRFRCSNLKLSMIRENDRVHMRPLSLQLSPKSRSMSNCMFPIAFPQVYPVESQSVDGGVHLECGRKRTLKCYKDGIAEPLVVLHILKLEYTLLPAALTSRYTRKPSLQKTVC